MLELEQVSKSLGDRRVLDCVDLTVGEGEVVVLLGPNGAGKTTLLGTACGRIAADEGVVRLCGGDPRSEPGVRSALGLVPQDIALYGYLSVRENLEVFGRMMGVDRAELSSRMTAALDQSGLAERADDKVSVLSGGMRRRLNIVASLLHHPQVLLLDEPTVGVDVGARERIHELLLCLRAEGLGVLLTTHDLHQAAMLADRVVFLLDGQVKLQGAPPDLIEQVFGTGRELTVTLSEPVAAEVIETLAARGLSVSSNGLSLTGAVDGAGEKVAELGQALDRMGLGVQEIRLKEPGLEGVFLRLTGEVLEL